MVFNPGKKIIVVGGGPAGMMAAIRAGQLVQEVTLIEKNSDLGRKLLLSGKGRCNLTNLCELNVFISRFSHHGEFLRDAFKKFFNQQLIRFFEERGLKLKTERQLRVFPVSNRAASIQGVLKKELLKNKVRVLCKCELRDILLKGREVKGVLLDNAGFLPADRIILATGGVSYAFTGSTGEGLQIAARLGHTIVPSRPALVPLETRQKYPLALEGLCLKNIRLKFIAEEKEVISDIGELLFTHSGISGPLVLTQSGRVVDWLSQARHVRVEIDLKPALSREQLDNRFLREFRENPKKGIKNILRSLLPSRLIDLFLELAKVNPHKKASQVCRSEREALIALLKGLRLDITSARPIDEGMVTRGGVSLRDIDPRTMESRKVKGLYLCGEMIDLDADTGGFNLQAAFSTGYLAGESASLN